MGYEVFGAVSAAAEVNAINNRQSGKKKEEKKKKKEEKEEKKKKKRCKSVGNMKFA